MRASDLGNAQAKGPRRAIGHAGILPVVRALEGRHGARDQCRAIFAAVLPFAENATHRGNAILDFMDNGNRPHLRAVL